MIALSNLNLVAVDDDPSISMLLKKALKPLCLNFNSFIEPYSALEFIDKNSVDIVISDIRMPNLNGIELCKEIFLIKPEVKIILLSASDDLDHLIEAINMGIEKFIVKPFMISKLLETLEKIATQITLQRDATEYYRALKEDFNRLKEEIETTQVSIINTLGNVVETRSKETAYHVNRVAAFSELIAKKLQLNKEDIYLLARSSPLHDVGKIGISDSILNKPGKLTDEEYKLIKSHSTIGYEILKSSKQTILKKASIIAYQHHEAWDGSGYPQGLKKDEIDISARITAVADVFDALSHDRCYKKAWEIELCFEFIKNGSEKSFDPQIVEIFLDSIPEILTIQYKYRE